MFGSHALKARVVCRLCRTFQRLCFCTLYPLFKGSSAPFLFPEGIICRTHLGELNDYNTNRGSNIICINALMISYVNIGGPLVADCIIHDDLEGGCSGLSSFVFKPFRVLTLWFDYGHWPEVNEALVEGIKTIQIDTWLQVTYKRILK